jgi:hypothetical protein
MKSILGMLVELTPDAHNARTVYENLFETPYLESSASHFQVRSTELLAANTASDYLRKVEYTVLALTLY